MTEMHIDTGITGAKRQSFRKPTPRADLKLLIDANPESSQDEIRNDYWDQVKDSPTLIRSFYDYWFDNNYHSLVRPMDVTAITRRRSAIKQLTNEIGEKIQQKIEERVKIVLLDMILPSGKPLRDSSREELLDLGGWAARIAEKLQPQQTVAEAGLSEEQLREAYASPA